jgi:hypothetical protein
MADEPVTAWREPLARRARRWAGRNRSVVTGAAVGILAGVIGLAAVLIVQTEAGSRLSRANVQLASSLEREGWAHRNLAEVNSVLADTNAELTRAKANVQARYDLAVQAIKTFHTGVSEDLRSNGCAERSSEDSGIWVDSATRRRSIRCVPGPIIGCC